MFRLVEMAVVALALWPAVAGAQTSTVPAGGDAPQAVVTLRDLNSGSVMTLARAGAAQSQRDRRDSLWNGVIVGAGLGAMAGLATSYAITDCSECAGFNVPLTFSVVGAGIGAALGAALDAGHTKRLDPLERVTRVRVSPVVAPKSRGVMAWIRF